MPNIPLRQHAFRAGRDERVYALDGIVRMYACPFIHLTDLVSGYVKKGEFVSYIEASSGLSAEHLG